MSFPWPGVKQTRSCSHLRLAASARIRAATNLTGPGRDAIAKHLPGPFGPITTIASGPVPEDGDERLGAQITTAIDEITGEAVSAVGDLVRTQLRPPGQTIC